MNIRTKVTCKFIVFGEKTSGEAHEPLKIVPAMDDCMPVSGDIHSRVLNQRVITSSSGDLFYEFQCL